jgi:uncharacterized protein YqjF (DUF2071 family)
MNTESPTADVLQLDPPQRVAHPTMIQQWLDLSFVHWRFDPADIRPLVPSTLEIDTFHGAAWVGLIPFRLRIRRPGVPYLPWLSSFPETNLRTYVVGPDGHRGIWFLSLDAARLGAVVAARASYRLPYMWAHAEMRRRGHIVRYRGRRRWPGRGTASYDLTIDVGRPLTEPTELDRFLSARWHLYSPERLRLPPTGLELVRTTVSHPAWPLFDARVERLEETVLAAAGLPSPATGPTALFSPGISTRFAPSRIALTG